MAISGKSFGCKPLKTTEPLYSEGKEYRGVDFSSKGFPIGEYENCSFSDCRFAGVTLDNAQFIDCEFDNCDLSNATLLKTGLKQANFKHCKLIGLHFEDCSEFLFAVSFSSCQLDFSTFYECSLSQIVFDKCRLKQCDFGKANLNGASFIDCDLRGAIFENTNLEGADFRSSTGFSINPSNNRLTKARFSRENIEGLLGELDIIIE